MSFIKSINYEVFDEFKKQRNELKTVMTQIFVKSIDFIGKTTIRIESSEKFEFKFKFKF